MTAVVVAASVMVSIHGALCIARLIAAPSLSGRLIALDAALLAIVNGIAIHALATGTTVYLDIMIITALLAFVGTAAVARFIEDRR